MAQVRRMPGRRYELNEGRSRGTYTLEFKQDALRQVKAGRTASVVAKTLWIPKASVTSWVRAEGKGQLGLTAQGESSLEVTPEQAEIARLRAEVARLKMQRDIAREWAAAQSAQDVLQGTPGSGRSSRAGTSR